MMIRLNWIEFVKAGRERLQQLHPDMTIGEPAFRTDHGAYNGGIGESYDLPHFVDFEVEQQGKVDL
jgi:hypothetical protein